MGYTTAIFLVRIQTEPKNCKQATYNSKGIRTHSCPKRQGDEMKLVKKLTSRRLNKDLDGPSFNSDKLATVKKKTIFRCWVRVPTRQNEAT
jgi:hypothetical protein